MKNTLEATSGVCDFLILYHADCIDGFTAAWACRRGLMAIACLEDEEILAIPVAYHTVHEVIDRILIDKLVAMKGIFIVDFSLPVEILELLEAREDLYLTVIDHHDSAIRKIKDSGYEESSRFSFYLDSCASGAKLVQYYFDLPMSKLIDYVSDYDTWKHELPQSKAINKYLRLQRQTLSIWDGLHELFNSASFSSIMDTAIAIEAYHDSLVHSAVREARPITLAGIKGLVVDTHPDLASDVGHILAEASCSYGATYNTLADGTVKFSLRSTDSYEDVSLIAEKFGGGGHRNAAGFVLSNPSSSLFPDEDDAPIGVTIWEEGDTSA